MGAALSVPPISQALFRQLQGESLKVLGSISVHAQLTYRESLRDIEACLRSRPNLLYHLGIRGHVARSTLADANEERDWRIYADLAQWFIARARKLYAHEELGLDLEETLYALD